jgi:dATP pyrophosphohydrolase
METTLKLPQAIKPPHIVAYIVKIEEGVSFYLLLRRVGKHLNGNWQMVSGGIELGETAYHAALREIQEETNLIPDRFYSADAVESFYDISKDTILFAPVFIAFIDTPQQVKLSVLEHDVYKWLPYDEAVAYLEFDNQRRILKHIENNFVLNTPNERHRILPK